jgi:uncharacterized protein YqgV (UPF0045/DUF77 family)
MQIGVEISLYPLNADYIPPIRDFIARLNTEPRLRIVTNAMSTQVFGEYDVVLPLLQVEIKRTFGENAKAVFVMKVLGPLADTP